ncbi:glycosyltransferase family 4 protein [Aliarcobacter cryaerophilus]|uniref:glycosyltransferase family 4 protein n=1 Tax=Aliarcobacter cryaerophilus TaxID=28198 RepID=UPI0021B633EF|nr:glycosyltransferase family 4 protein [Aliarcobacter cryaerophilus]MCT7405745.1 glycosyltransferase family 4 protein [Aliarcobacter cryaerophilus]MCT7503312.1 glycosyltransferase family 4 protein [Aliarcobacter cryaerophilus]
MNNLHISLTEMRNESRVLKETNSILNHNIASKVYIASLHADDLEEEKLYNDNIILNRFKLSSRKFSKNLFFQVLKYFEFLYRITFFYKKKNIKMVNIHSIALLPFGVFLKYFYGAKLIYDTHELETETGDYSPMRKKIVKFIEKHLIKKCDLVFVVSENIADWYSKEYNLRRPIVVKNAPRFFNAKKTNHFRENLSIKEDSIIVLYQGGLSKGRGVDLLLESFKQRDDDKVVIVFMGYGEIEEEIKKASKEKNNIFFHSAVAPEVVLEYTSSADFGIHMIQNTCLNHYYCLPNKLFEYAMAGLPVIVSNMKEMRELVEKYDMGIVVTDDKIESMNNAIDKILQSDIKQMKQNARRCAEENSWEVQEIKMINEYKRFLL